MNIDPKTAKNLSGVLGTASATLANVKNPNQANLDAMGATLTNIQNYLNDNPQKSSNKISGSPSVDMGNKTGTAVKGAVTDASGGSTAPATPDYGNMSTGDMMKLSTEDLNKYQTIMAIKQNDATLAQAKQDKIDSDQKASDLVVSEKAALAASTAASYSEEASSFSQQFAELDQQQSAAHNSITEQAAKLNPYGGVDTALMGYQRDTEAKFTAAKDQLRQADLAARDAIAAGDAKGANDIMENAYKNFETNKTNLATQTEKHFADQLELTKFVQDTKYQDAQMANMTAERANTLLTSLVNNAPSDDSKITPDAIDAATKLYQSINPAATSSEATSAATQMLQNSAKANSAKIAQDKLALQSQTAGINLQLKQAQLAEKQMGLLDTQKIASADKGTSYNTALDLASAANKSPKYQVESITSSLANFLSAGNYKAAQQTITNYVLSGKPASTKTAIDGLQTTAAYVNNLVAQIKTLPADQQTGFWKGSIQSMESKFGQNPNPKLATLGAEFGHLALLYKSNVFGKKAIMSNDPTLKNLFPSQSDSPSLNLSTLQGIMNTANSTLNGEVSGVITQETFDQIYGAKGVLGVEGVETDLSKPDTTKTLSGIGIGSYTPSFKVDDYISTLTGNK